MPFTLKRKKTIAELRKRVKRRRFYNALSLKKSPCLGLSIAVLLSFAFYKILPHFAYSGIPFQSAQWNVPFYVLLEWIAFWWICTFAHTALGTFLKELVAGKWKSRLLDFFACIMFFPCGVLLLVSYAKRKMRWGSAVLFGLSLILFAFAVTCDAKAGSATIALLQRCAVALQAPLLIAGLWWLAPDAPYRKTAYVVLGLSICLALAYLNMGPSFRQRYVMEDARVWQLLNEDSEAAKAECRWRFDAVREPLSEMLDCGKRSEEIFPYEKHHYYNKGTEVLALYEDIMAKSPSFREKLLAFSEKCPPPIMKPVCKTDDTEWDGSPDLPEIGFVRYASRFLALEMRAKASDASVVQADNAALARLRDWIAHGGTDSHKTTAFIVERMRLNALANTLPKMRYSEQTWRELLGDAPDWRRISAYASAAEYGRFFAFSFIKQYVDKPFVTLVLKCLESGISIWDVHVAAPAYDLLVFSEATRASTYARIIQVTLDEKADYKNIRDIKQEIRQTSENGYLLFISDICDYQYRNMLSIENERRMALIAWRLAEYMHTHEGALPESLSVLGDVPNDAQNEQPFGYVHGCIAVPVDSKGNTVQRQGVVLYSHDWEGKLPAWDKAPARIAIFLD